MVFPWYSPLYSLGIPLGTPLNLDITLVIITTATPKEYRGIYHGNTKGIPNEFYGASKGIVWETTLGDTHREYHGDS